MGNDCFTLVQKDITMFLDFVKPGHNLTLSRCWENLDPRCCPKVTDIIKTCSSLYHDQVSGASTPKVFEALLGPGNGLSCSLIPKAPCWVTDSRGKFLFDMGGIVTVGILAFLFVLLVTNTCIGSLQR